MSPPAVHIRAPDVPDVPGVRDVQDVQVHGAILCSVLCALCSDMTACLPPLPAQAMAALPSRPAGLPSPNPTRSFWHRSPSPFLLHHRSTPELPPAADVVIVGSGITGAFCAKYLAESAGLKVVMVDAREACWGATGRVG